ncbi:acyltransferase [Myroides sp. BIT-d1]|uniref:Acyltransferase n=1 Tax=Myroides albus TaxID=2562892 RepID=A0A6I3LRF4_9FLAO|nr:acyltransferase [Myroides albus]MTG98555.1 acyltransferase [Myroides albus]
MHLIFKIFDRIFRFTRGFFFYSYVKLCGGTIKSIPRIGKNVIWKYPPHKGVSFGFNLDIGSNSFIEVPKGSTLKVGDNVKFTFNVVISALNRVEIGNDTLIAEFCSLRDSTHKTEKFSPIRKQDALYGNIIVGNDVWIGRNCTILMNVVLDDGCIIGANSLCSKNRFKKNCVYIGVPAKFLKNR